MNQLTYKEAENLIFDAYFKDEILPFKSTFCFCGTLAPNEYSNEGFKNWNNHDGKFDQSKHFYTLNEYARMEEALFIPLGAYNGTISNLSPDHLNEGDIYFEDALFKGMCAALEVLKIIHLQRGEVIDNPVNLKKRELQKI